VARRGDGVDVVGWGVEGELCSLVIIYCEIIWSSVDKLRFRLYILHLLRICMHLAPCLFIGISSMTFSIRDLMQFQHTFLRRQLIVNSNVGTIR
jgi:hypothetical protein